MRAVEKIKFNIDSKIREVENEENISLDPVDGCLWCYRPRMPSSLYCCPEHKYKFEWYNGKPDKDEDTK